jgi:hypothetical protein
MSYFSGRRLSGGAMGSESLMVPFASNDSRNGG